jgi:predicted Ser/Thr protein kinase
MIGQTLALRYRVEEKLGEGGMGVVYRAFDLRLGRTIALKMLRPELMADSSLQKRLATEAKATSALNHASIATLYDFESADEGAFLIYEFIKGRTLRIVQMESPLDMRRLLSVYAAIAGGIAAAHEAGIIHRDLKPENIMIREDGQVKILDFGLAKFSRSSLTGVTLPTATLPGLLLGTVAYMSPEQLEGETIDRRSDIFSMGTMLFEAATGQHPFEGKSPSSTIGNILKEEPRETGHWIPGAHPELERTIRKCLRKNKEERYQSASEIVVDLEAIRRDLEPGGARPGSGAEPAETPFTLPVRTALAKVLFQLLQVAYLAVYATALRWGPDNPYLFSLRESLGSVGIVGVPTMCGIATRIYLMSAVGWSHPDAGRKFLWLFPWLVIFDGLLWGASPILLWDHLHELSLFLVAVMAYLPFAQRTLIRAIYPGVTIRISRSKRPSSGHA